MDLGHQASVGAKARPLSMESPTRHQIGGDRNVRDTIEARRHAQVQSHTPKRFGGGLVLDHFGTLVFGAEI